LQRKLVAASRTAPGLPSTHQCRLAATPNHDQEHREHSMSKGMDSKKSEKKKPAKTMKEKKAAKQEKKKNQ
jgi:hypothetical protein